MLFEKESKNSVEEVARKVEEATKANGFGVMGVFDLKMKMAEKGVDFAPECRIIEVCNPHQAKKVLDADIAISTVLPCRISVYERAGSTFVAMVKPTAMLAMFDNPDLQQVAQSVEDTMIRIIETATG
ncbi:MAG: DUF302 domain-containing protein [bacterium]